MYKNISTDKYYQKLLNSTHNPELLIKSGYIDEDFILSEDHLNIFLTQINKLKKPKTNKPIVLLTTGAFNPLHKGHINILDSAWKQLESNGHEVIGGYFSPANDEYVSKKVEKDFEIEKRIGKSLEILSNSKYNFCLFPSVNLNIELNFTKIITYLENYLKKHYHKKVKICYVYGSDNEDFGYLFHYNNELMACCIKRPNYKFKHHFKNVSNININEVKISSTDIRNIVEKTKTKEIKTMYLKDDRFYSLKNINFKNKNEKYEIFKSNLSILFKKYFKNINIIDNKNIIFIQKNDNILSLDEINKCKFNLEITRVFELDFYNKKPLCLSNRINTDSIEKQIKKQNLNNKSLILFDDDSASGFTIKEIRKKLENNNIIIKEVIFNQKINYKNEDICDIRDFLIGSKGSGLTIKYKYKKYKVPYIFPFVNLNLRSSIPYKDIINFSKSLIEINIEFYKNEDVLLKEINSNLYDFFEIFNINKNIKMIDFLYYLKSYFNYN